MADPEDMADPEEDPEDLAADPEDIDSLHHLGEVFTDTGDSAAITEGDALVAQFL